MMQPALVLLVVVCISDIAIAQVTRRQTDSIVQDTVDGMITARAYDDAAWYTRRIWKRAEADSDLAARAAIGSYRVAISSLAESGTLDSERLWQSAGDVIEFFQSYDDHRRVPWWHAAQREADRVITEAAVARVLIGDPDVSADAVSRRIVEIGLAVESLRREIQEDRQRLARDHSFMADEFISLDRQLAIESLRLSILQIELFPPQSEERIAAAAAAVSQAERTLQTLPNDSNAAQTAQYWMAVSLFHAGQWSQSRTRLKTVNVAPVKRIALEVELDLAEQKMESAKTRLADFYGVTPENAPQSLAMDLARLKFLLIQESPDGKLNPAASQWLETMGRRGGRYAARRGEAVLLSGLSGKTAQRRETDTVASGANEVVAIQGRRWIREGDAMRGGQLLSSAATNESNAEAACQFAIESAAAFASVNQNEAVAKVLLETSRRFRINPAPAMHYQGIHALLSLDDPVSKSSSGQIEALLQEHLGLFPHSPYRDKAREWLIGIFDQTDRMVDAAIYAVGSDADQRWKSLFTGFRHDPLVLSATLIDSLDLLSDVQEKNDRRELILEIADLGDWGTHQDFSSQTLSSRAAAIWQFRNGATDQLSVSPTPTLTAALVRDAILAPSRRKFVANYLLKVAPESTKVSDRILALIWLNRESEALALANQFPVDSDQANDLRSIAISLGRSNSPKLKRHAVEIYDTLAAGMPRGTDRWHEVKWSAISLLASVDPEEVRKRSKYILLTEKNLPPVWKQRYEQAASGS